MVTWFKHDIPAWMDGTEGLEDGPYRTYHVICQLIYLNEGPITLNEVGIAGRCKQHILAFRRNLRTLIDLQKLLLVDGRLSNNRASTELQSLANHRATSARGGRGSAGVAKSVRRDTEVVEEIVQRDTSNNPLKTNGTATVPLLDTQHHKTREEKSIYSPDGKPSRPSRVYSEDFDLKFWLPYPRTPNMSKSEAWHAWKKLSADEQASACKAIDPYKQFLRSKPTQETVHACRFLSQKRFEGFVNGASALPFDIKGHFV